MLLSTIMVASLLGSTHCAGMCGAFAAFSVGAPTPAGSRAASRWSLAAAYNLGRLATYVLMGVMAGAVGAAVDLGGSMVGVQRAAAVGAGAVMVVFGAVAVARALGARVGRAPLPKWMVSAARSAHMKAIDLPPVTRAATVGLLTTLLPCGWLYTFVVAAAGTGGPLSGAAAMGAFWIGTLPVMGAIGLGVRALTGPLRRHLPLVTSLLMVAAGVWTVLGRMTAPVMAAPSARVPDGPSGIAEFVEQADEACPYCHPETLREEKE
ncbi:MAG: sulfite exporter TauE/SafE family protein [Phycisphaerales bacterium]|nr:sulfite exporter TauE/SafE family protein [Phycisphaerales bacterium]